MYGSIGTSNNCAPQSWLLLPAVHDIKWPLFRRALDMYFAYIDEDKIIEFDSHDASQIVVRLI